MDTKTLTDSLARRLDYNKKDVAVLLESLSSVVREHCGELDSIAVPGFGCFEPNAVTPKNILIIQAFGNSETAFTQTDRLN